MKVPHQDEKNNQTRPGRLAQKDRTRRDLLASARELVGSGRAPTIEEAADAARISRTTAYRYFPTREALLSEAAAEPLIDAIGAIVRSVDTLSNPVQRVDEVFRQVVPLILARESELRTILSITLGRSLRDNLSSDATLQSVRWIQAWDPLLEPLRDRVTPPIYVLMTRSVSSLLGIEPLMALKDAADGDPAGTTAAARFAARAMVRGFLSAPALGGADKSAPHDAPPSYARRATR